MAIVDLGKITFVNKGAWNKATNYEIKEYYIIQTEVLGQA